MRWWSVAGWAAEQATCAQRTRSCLTVRVCAATGIKEGTLHRWQNAVYFGVLQLGLPAELHRVKTMKAAAELWVALKKAGHADAKRAAYLQMMVRWLSPTPPKACACHPQVVSCACVQPAVTEKVLGLRSQPRLAPPACQTPEQCCAWQAGHTQPSCLHCCTGGAGCSRGRSRRWPATGPGRAGGPWQP